MQVSSLCCVQVGESACNPQRRYVYYLNVGKRLSANLRDEQEILFLTKRKQSPTIHIYQGKVLTGDTLNRNAVKGGNFGYGLEPEYPAWVRSAHSSPRTLN